MKKLNRIAIIFLMFILCSLSVFSANVYYEGLTPNNKIIEFDNYTYTVMYMVRTSELNQTITSSNSKIVLSKKSLDGMFIEQEEFELGIDKMFDNRKIVFKDLKYLPVEETYSSYLKIEDLESKIEPVITIQKVLDDDGNLETRSNYLIGDEIKVDMIFNLNNSAYSVFDSDFNMYFGRDIRLLKLEEDIEDKTSGISQQYKDFYGNSKSIITPQCQFKIDDEGNKYIDFDGDFFYDTDDNEGGSYKCTAYFYITGFEEIDMNYDLKYNNLQQDKYFSKIKILSSSDIVSTLKATYPSNITGTNFELNDEYQYKLVLKNDNKEPVMVDNMEISISTGYDLENIFISKIDSSELKEVSDKQISVNDFNNLTIMDDDVFSLSENDFIGTADFTKVFRKDYFKTYKLSFVVKPGTSRTIQLDLKVKSLNGKGVKVEDFNTYMFLDTDNVFIYDSKYYDEVKSSISKNKDAPYEYLEDKFILKSIVDGNQQGIELEGEALDLEIRTENEEDKLYTDKLNELNFYVINKFEDTKLENIKIDIEMDLNDYFDKFNENKSIQPFINTSSKYLKSTEIIEGDETIKSFQTYVEEKLKKNFKEYMNESYKRFDYDKFIEQLDKNKKVKYEFFISELNGGSSVNIMDLYLFEFEKKDYEVNFTYSLYTENYDKISNSTEYDYFDVEEIGDIDTEVNLFKAGETSEEDEFKPGDRIIYEIQGKNENDFEILNNSIELFLPEDLILNENKLFKFDIDESNDYQIIKNFMIEIPENYLYDKDYFIDEKELNTYVRIVQNREYDLLYSRVDETPLMNKFNFLLPEKETIVNKKFKIINPEIEIDIHNIILPESKTRNWVLINNEDYNADKITTKLMPSFNYFIQKGFENYSVSNNVKKGLIFVDKGQLNTKESPDTNPEYAFMSIYKIGNNENVIFENITGLGTNNSIEMIPHPSVNRTVYNDVVDETNFNKYKKEIEEEYDIKINNLTLDYKIDGVSLKNKLKSYPIFIEYNKDKWVDNGYLVFKFMEDGELFDKEYDGYNYSFCNGNKNITNDGYVKCNISSFEKYIYKEVDGTSIKQTTYYYIEPMVVEKDNYYQGVESFIYNDEETLKEKYEKDETEFDDDVDEMSDKLFAEKLLNFYIPPVVIKNETIVNETKNETEVIDTPKNETIDIDIPDDKEPIEEESEIIKKIKSFWEFLISISSY